MERTESQKQKEHILRDGYRLHKDRIHSDESTSWRCVKKDCKGRLKFDATDAVTIHALIDNSAYPLIYTLLPDKTEQSYERILRKLQEFRISLQPASIIFEKASQNACIAVFPGARIVGCFFHLGQCLWRKVQEFNLADSYRDDENFDTNSPKFTSVLAFRQQHTQPGAWGRSDFYVVCRMRPLTFELSPCSHEIVKCQWMPVQELHEHAQISSITRRVASLVMFGLEHGFNRVDVTPEQMESIHKGLKFHLFHRPLPDEWKS